MGRRGEPTNLINQLSKASASYITLQSTEDVLQTVALKPDVGGASAVAPERELPPPRTRVRRRVSHQQPHRQSTNLSQSCVEIWFCAIAEILCNAMLLFMFDCLDRMGRDPEESPPSPGQPFLFLLLQPLVGLAAFQDWELAGSSAALLS